jgi:hypothetical protein
MSDNLSNFLENKLLEHSTGRTPYTAPSHVYLGLYTVAPTDSAAGTEATGGNYARVQLAFGAASEGTIATNAAAAFGSTGFTVALGTILAMAISDSPTVGNILWYALLSPSFTLGVGDTFTVQSGGITLALS